LQHFHPQQRRVDLGKCGEDKWTISLETCPNCNDAVISLFRFRPMDIQTVIAVYPRSVGRPPLSADVPEAYAQDYYEAAALLADSPKASAALGRRCLRRLLHEAAFIEASDLCREIDILIATRHLPKYLADAVDAVRNIGNFANYPLKCTSPAEVQDVEPGEAEWLLDTLDSLFAFYFVQPAEANRKRLALLSKVNIPWRNKMPTRTQP
jgi:hypothetical protein